MTWFKSISSRFAAVGVLSAVLGFLLAWPVFATGQDKKDPAPDPAAKQAPPTGGPTDANKDLAEQIKQLNAKVSRLEAALPKTAQASGDSGSIPAGGQGVKAQDKGVDQGARIAAKFQNCLQCHQTRPSGPLPPSHLDMTASATAPPPSGQAKSAVPDLGDGKMQGKGMGMMGGMGMGMMGGMGGKKPAMPMMDNDRDKMGGKGMDKMGGMDGKKPAMPMMDNDRDKMGGMGMEGKGMDKMDDDMDMMGMMGMGSMGGMKGKKMKMTSALPGFPGASHIYHIGASDFFLDHPQHITLSAEQETKLVKMKQMGLTAKATGQRKIEEAEQQLWELTAADMPDATKIDAKVREAEKLRGDQRLAFIRTVGEAALVLTDDQRKILIGQAQPTAPDSHATHPKKP
jgi:hypothetical protein